MTPGTATTRRKTVSFGAHVVDNEGKKTTRTGLPSNCPGKFPSPWTPRTDVAPDTKNRTKLTAALYEARTFTDPTSPAKHDARAFTAPLPPSPLPSPAKPRAKDDADLTLDALEPRSESGRYWKEQYLTYASRSEREVKRLIKKHHLAKSYAKKRDAEATELAAKLEEERTRHKSREKALETQLKEYQERLRQSLAVNLASTAEIAALKRRLEDSGKGKGEGTKGAKGDAKADLADTLSVSRSAGSGKSEVSARSKQSRRPKEFGGSRTPQILKQQRDEATLSQKDHVIIRPTSLTTTEEPQGTTQALQPRSENSGKEPLPGDRFADAKARIAARKREKENVPIAALSVS